MAQKERKEKQTGRNQVWSGARQADRKKGEERRQIAGRQTVQKAARKTKKKKSFEVARMWVSVALSLLERDRGKIPPNIGNHVLISNNVYATKAYLTSYIHITELSLDTPVTLVSEIMDYLRDNGSPAVVDTVIKNSPYEAALGESGLKSRIRMWESALNSKLSSQSEKEVAARCLYTIEQIRAGARLCRSRIFLEVRAKTGTELSYAEKLVARFLDSIHASYLPIKADMQEYFAYVSIISDSTPKWVKDIKAVITSDTTLSQLLPNSGSFNDRGGIFCGINILNNTEFRINLADITIARNIYILAPSGVGKTVLALNMAASALENGMAVCLMDIKGNEMTSLVEGSGGYVVSLRPESVEYVNSFKLHRDDATDESAEMYYKSQIGLCKQQMITLVSLPDARLRSELEEYLDEFLESVYVSLGVLPSNRSTWDATTELNPFVIYKMLVQYTTPEVMRRFTNTAKKAVTALKMYMTREGSKSYIFMKEFRYNEILNAPSLSFDFGLLEESTSSGVDPVLFELRFQYMRKLNADYVAHKHGQGVQVFKVLEESQIVSDDILHGYVEEFTLRRAQGQTTVLLGNSITALTANPISRPLIENVRGLFVGTLSAEAREEAIHQFDLEPYRELLSRLGSNEKYTNSFLFVNRMQKNAVVPIVKVVLEPGVRYKLLRQKRAGTSIREEE